MVHMLLASLLPNRNSIDMLAVHGSSWLAVWQFQKHACDLHSLVLLCVSYLVQVREAAAVVAFEHMQQQLAQSKMASEELLGIFLDAARESTAAESM